MKIVTNGTHYAIEKGWLFKKYLSLYSDSWFTLKESIDFCWSKDKEIIKKRYNFLLSINKNNIKPIETLDE